MRRDVGAGVGLATARRRRSPRRAPRAAGSAPSAPACPASVIAPAAQALHREREVGQPRMKGQRLAQEHSARESSTSARRRALPARIAQPAAAAEHAHQLAAGASTSSPCSSRAGAAAPRRRARAPAARCASLEERASRGSEASHHQSPSNTGFCLADERLVGAAEVLGLHADAPAPALRPRSPGRRPSPIPGAACVLVMPCAKVGPSASSRGQRLRLAEHRLGLAQRD